MLKNNLGRLFRHCRDNPAETLDFVVIGAGEINEPGEAEGRCLQNRCVEGSRDPAGIACKTCKDFRVLQACLTFVFQNDRNAATAAYHRPRR